MSLAKTARKVILGSFAVAAISYGLRLYAQQQNPKLTPPPKANPSQSPLEISSGEPSLVVGERLVYNVSWSSFPSAARVEMEIVAQGQFYGRESVQLRARVETLGQMRSLFGDVDNQYTSYVSPGDAVPYRVLNALHQGQKRSDEMIVFDHSRGKAIFSDDVDVPIREETYDLTSALYGLRLRPLGDGAKYKFTVLHDKKLIEVEAVVKGRERVVAQAGAFNAILVRYYPKGKYYAYRGLIYISEDAQRLPVMIKANLPSGEVRAELTNVTFSASSESPRVKLDFPPDESGRLFRSPPATGESGNGVIGDKATSPTDGHKPGLDAESTPKEYPFVVGERLGYDISWGAFPSVGKASFEVRQQGIYNGNRVIEFFGEASSVGMARSLIDVNDQVSSLVLMDSLFPIRTELRLREGKRSKQTTATYDRSKNLMSLSNGSQAAIPSDAYDLLSLFYAVRAANLKIGTARDFNFFDANNRPQRLTIKVVKQETIAIPFGGRDALQVDVFGPEPPKPLLAQVWVSNDSRHLPLYLVTRARFGELRFQLLNVINSK